MHMFLLIAIVAGNPVPCNIIISMYIYIAATTGVL